MPGREEGGAPAEPPGGAGSAPAPPSGVPRPRRGAPPASVTVSLSVLATLGIVGLLHYAASVFITIASSLVIASALESPVRFLARRSRLPRPFASAVVVFLAIALLYGVLYLAYTGLQDFLSDLPALGERIRTSPAIAQLTEKARGIARGVEELTRGFQPPPPREKATPIFVESGRSYVEAVYRGLGSLGTVVFSLSFIPFLVYFILAEKEPLTRRTLALFPGREEEMRRLLDGIEETMHRFLVGNAIVAGILSLATVVVFRATGLPYGLALGVLSGIVSTVPYVGLVLALLPGVLVGLVSFDSGLPFLVVIGAVTGLHLFAANFLIPRLIGGRTHLNAVVSTLALLFFGWLWGGMGLLLAIPIAAVLKIVLDHGGGSARRIGQWMGDAGAPGRERT